MEGRVLLAGVPLPMPMPVGAPRGSLIDDARSLGSFGIKTKKAAKGAVGGTQTHAVYKVDVKAAMNLKVELTKLAQRNRVQVLFEDGTPLNQGWTNGRKTSLKFSQRLDPGTYYIDVSHGYIAGIDKVGGGGFAAAPAVAAKKGGPKRYNFKKVDAFQMRVAGSKAGGTAAPQPPEKVTRFASVFGDEGAAAQPDISAQLAADVGFAGYADFGGSPLWGPSGPEADDVIQGSLGDCYFMAMISNIARTDPGLIEQSIVPQANGNFLVKFNINGQEVVQPVDAALPVSAAGTPVFAQVDAEGTLWPALMEKAFCFVRADSVYPGTYDGIGDGGLPSESLLVLGSTDAGEVVQSDFSTVPRFLDTLDSWLDQGAMVTLNTQQPPGWRGEKPMRGGLYTGHAYSLVGVDEGTGRVVLRNPWATNTRGTDDGSGGYITLSGAYALESMASLSFGTVPQFADNPNPVPTPVPVPAPDPQIGVTPGTLGESSYKTDEDRNFDVYTFVATADGTASVVIEADAFAPQLLVAEVLGDGELWLVGTDTNDAGGTTAYVTFSVTAGTRYTIGVFTDSATDTGGYALGLVGVLGEPTRLSPSATPDDASTGSLSGGVFHDADGDGSPLGEAGQGGWTVYLDADNSGSLTDGDTYTTTTDAGDYAFTGLTAGEYVVRVVPDDAYVQTEPAGDNTGWRVQVVGGENTDVNLFGQAPIFG